MAIGARPRGRPRVRSAQGLRVAVADAAMAVFADEGVAGASMSAVASRAGVPRAAVYELYRTKQDLYDAVVTDELERFAAHMVDAYRSSATDRVRERVRSRYRAVFDYAANRPTGFRLLSRVRAERTDAVAAGTDRTRDRLTRVLTDVLRAELGAVGLPDGQLADVLAWLFLGLGEAVVRGCAANPAWRPDAVIELAVEATLGVGGADRAVLEAADRPVGAN